MRHPCKVKRLKVKKSVRAARDTIWAERAGLEQILLLVSAGLVGLLVAAWVALARKSTPLATDWGPVADRVGDSVTFLGFVGAIAAHGDEAYAKAWVAARTFATFTDQARNKWKLNGAGNLTDVSG